MLGQYLGQRTKYGSLDGLTASVHGLELVQTHADFFFRHREPLAGVQCSLAQKTNSGRLTRSRMSSWIVRLTFHSRAVSISASLVTSIWPLRSVAGGLGFKSETKGQPGTPLYYGDVGDGYKCEYRRSTTRIAHRSNLGACFYV